jgi:hypothetical protein
MVGRCTASAIASASRKSFLLPVRNAFSARPVKAALRGVA